MESVFLYSKTVEQFFKKNKLKDEYSFELTNCPVCDSVNFKKLFEQYGFNYFRCRNCTFVFVNPRLNDEGSSLWYNSEFYNAALETEYDKFEKGNRYSSSLDTDIFDQTLELLKQTTLNKDAAVLEIGCGNGAFLEYLKINAGFENSLGIDLSKKAVEFAKNKRGLNVKQLNVNNLNSGSKFDLIISMESIEHANDLNSFMNNVNRNSKDKSFLLITTPYNDSKATYLGSIWGDHYMAPNHINFFNLKSIKLFLQKYGFSIYSKKIIDGYLGIDLIKYRLKYKRDWASSLPPVQVEENVIIPKKENENIRFVRYKQNGAGNSGHINNHKQQKNKIIYNLLKNSYHGIADIFNLKWKSHFIIIAQKN